ncbi:MAG: LamG domain-containing protein, partial [Candidatus Kariarchaeaceae archaeon]
MEGSLDFDDADRKVDISHSSSLQFSSDIWVSAWIKTSDSESDVDVVLAKWGSSVDNRNYFLGKLDDTTFAFYVDETQSVTIGLSKVNDGNWHHVVGVADSDDGSLKIFVDGVEENTASYDGSSVTGSSPLYFGQNPGEVLQEWNGGIDECRVSNIIHAAEWIQTEYNTQLNPTSTSILASEFVLDKTPPIINDFGTEDPGTGTGRFWTDVSDSISTVDSVVIKVNGTEYDMSFNGSKWIYLTSVAYGDTYEYQIANASGDTYEYQIANASDVRENYITSPSSTKFASFTEDSVSPDVVDWEYFPEEGVYGTFKANVSDSWGTIDTVIVNVTEGTVPQGERWAVMRNDSIQYVNDTVIMDSGSIKFVIFVNDTAGNSYTSSEHQGFVPVINHPPEAQNVTLSRSSSLELLPIYSNSTLYLDYDFYDQDSDSEGGTEIRWYKNGVLQSSYNDAKQNTKFAIIPPAP